MRRHLIDFGLLAALVLGCLLLFTSGLDTVPPLDRDEPRFAQASRQMLETGDFIDIRFQDQPRYKKPVGIYWLQAASVSLFGEARETSLWAWRLVSVVGALAAVLSTYWAGRILFDRRAAYTAAAVLGGSLLLAVEAHIAKTDAVLLACIVAAEAALAHAYMAGRRDPPTPAVGPRSGPGTGPSTGLAPALVFWIAIGAGILIKGPVGPNGQRPDHSRLVDPRPPGGLAESATLAMGTAAGPGDRRALVHRDLGRHRRRVPERGDRRRPGPQTGRKPRIERGAARHLSGVGGHYPMARISAAVAVDGSTRRGVIPPRQSGSVWPGSSRPGWFSS